MILFSSTEVPEVLEVHEIPSVKEVIIVPESPTTTNFNDDAVVSVDDAVVSVVDSSLSSPQEMTVILKRKSERIMSICLTRFPISGLGET